MSRKYPVARSFRFAFEGLKEAIFNEPNFQIHTLVGFAALMFGIMLGLTRTEWVIIVFTIAFVLILELFNTAIEKIVDLVNPNIHPKAKIAKDVSAAAVLLSAMVSVFVGIVIFVPKIIHYFNLN